MVKKITESSPYVAIITILLLLSLNPAIAGPAAYGICQAGCSAVVVACYAAAGAVFGTVTAGIGTPHAIVACNTAYGTCQSACWAALYSPTL
ncbi:hypothetical protein niasHS_016121 [Heterodera schachtii]|uniref:Cysteine-rich protein n=1 Tax=Heterodera schachtii TaxID=97005 RepID=A0ABD2HQQ4_HETSC